MIRLRWWWHFLDESDRVGIRALVALAVLAGLWMVRP